MMSVRVIAIRQYFSCVVCEALDYLHKPPIICVPSSLRYRCEMLADITSAADRALVDTTNP
jgi:hypothetical protein